MVNLTSDLVVRRSSRCSLVMRSDHHPLSECLSGSGFPSPLNGSFIPMSSISALIATTSLGSVLCQCW
jgi:hypothetical protein